MRRLAALMIAALGAGCASTVSLAPVEHCNAAPPAGMARVIASRTSSGLGGAGAIGVIDDGQPMGELGPGGRICWWRHPGTAYVSATIPPQAPGISRDIDLPLAAGQTVWIEIALGEPWKVLRTER